MIWFGGGAGTGKTLTIVEATLQLLRRPAPMGNAPGFGVRILLTAPQNYSADLLCSALAEAGVGPDEMVRVNDPRRPPPTVKEDVLPFCAMSDALRAFALPSVLELGQRRVVVCSCIAAGPPSPLSCSCRDISMQCGRASMKSLT